MIPFSSFNFISASFLQTDRAAADCRRLFLKYNKRKKNMPMPPYLCNVNGNIIHDSPVTGPRIPIQSQNKIQLARLRMRRERRGAAV